MHVIIKFYHLSIIDLSSLICKVFFTCVKNLTKLYLKQMLLFSFYSSNNPEKCITVYKNTKHYN